LFLYAKYDKIVGMKTRLLFLLPIILPNIALADDWFLPERNPFMGTYQNQMFYGIGQGFDTGILLPPPVRPVPFYIGTITYSQPTTFFRIPARRSLNISETLGLGSKNGWDWTDYTIPIGYATEDIALFRYKRLYMGMGAGVGLQVKENKRLGAKLLFQFKVTIGVNITQEWATELFIQHFSNANTAEDNHSYAFYGLGLTHNF
jgi:hypothetical protein